MDGTPKLVSVVASLPKIEYLTHGFPNPNPTPIAGRPLFGGSTPTSLAWYGVKPEGVSH